MAKPSLSLNRKHRFSLVTHAAEMAEAEEAEEAEEEPTSGTADPLRLPITVKQQNDAVVAAVQRAQEAGIARQRIRILVPREGNLRPPDETWQGGIMELYFAITPVVQDFLRALAPRLAGVPARLVEQRLDSSGVDGESLWMAQAGDAKDDVSVLVQPSVETASAIEQVCESAGSRLVLMVNPQYRETDDTLDYIAKSGGVFGKVATFLGGKGAFVQRLAELGFQDTFSLQQYVIRGTEVKYYKSYPSDWQIFVTGDDDEPIFLGSSPERPDYNRIDEVLESNGVAAKYSRDLDLQPKLTADSITKFY